MSMMKFAGLRGVYEPSAFRGFGVILLIAVSLQGCTHTRRLSATAPQSSYDHVNAQFFDKAAKVRMEDGGLFNLHSVQFQADSTRWLSPTEGRVTRTAQAVLSAEIKSASKGMLDGALIGGAVGIGIGFLSEHDNVYDGCEGSCVAQMAVGGILWGVIIGAVRKSTIRVVRSN